MTSSIATARHDWLFQLARICRVCGVQAYVLEADPIHENSVNYFSAALGFHRLGYQVERYRLSELPLLRVSAETPVFGGIQSILRLFPAYRSLPHYPVELAGFLGREIQVKRLAEVKQGEFFKPLEQDQKKFAPMILDDSVAASIAVHSMEPDHRVYVSEEVSILSEYRCYVHHGEPAAIHCYKGDVTIFPDRNAILDMIEAYTSAPVAYGLDVGVLESGETVLIGVNDFCCLGNYGIRPTPYAFGIASRWEQLWAQYRTPDVLQRSGK
jgi:hypothetical protein